MEDAQFLEELYSVIEKYGDRGYENIIAEKASYRYLYHLSSIRQNLIDWIPMEENARVLECRPECGALTGKLLEKVATVTCLAEDEAHATIIRARCKGAGDRLTMIIGEAGSFLSADETKACGKYDVILLVGSFYRYADALTVLRQQLATGGRLIVADANRMGLKYFAGCKEEYGEDYFSGIEGYQGETSTGQIPRCYTKGEYERYLKEAGFEKLTFYYPYPDYKFPNCIYSDVWLPQKGELADNRRNFETDRLQLFDEQKVYDTLLKEGLFGAFSNSYLIEAYE